MREDTGNQIAVDMERLITDLKAVVRDSQDLLKAGYGTVKEKAKVGAEKTSVYVHEKPYHTIGAAFGLGLLAGFLVAGILKGEPDEES